MRATIYFTIFVLTAFCVNVSGDLHMQMISTMAASKLSDAWLALIYPSSATPSLYYHVQHFPLAVKFIGVDGRDFIGKANQLRYIMRAEPLQHVLNARFYFLPWYRNRTVKMQAYIWRQCAEPTDRLFVFGNSHEETLRVFSRSICSVTSVTEESFNIPLNRFKECNARLNVTANELFVVKNNENTLPSGNEYRVCYDVLTGLIPKNDEMMAVLDAYRSRNNSFIQDCTYRQDFTVGENLNRLFVLYGHYIHALYSPSSLCLFSRPGRVTEFLEYSWESLIRLHCNLAFLGILIMLCSWLRNRISSSGRRFPLGNFVLVLVCICWGRCPHDSAGSVAKLGSISLAMWMIGMLFLGSYIQTVVIGISVIAVTSNGIANVDQLRLEIEGGIVRPCLSKAWPINIRKFLRLTTAGLKLCGDDCSFYEKESRCYRKASEGTHVVMATCGEYDVLRAAQWGLVPGEPQGFTLLASPMRIDHPLRYQHRRMLLAVTEGGLAVPFRRKRARESFIGSGGLGKRRPPESKPTEELSATLLLFCAVYGLGLFVSTVALMSDILWHKWANRRRNSGEVCWRLRLPWTRTAAVRPFSA